jgi:hypothetical protein
MTTSKKPKSKPAAKKKAARKPQPPARGPDRRLIEVLREWFSADGNGEGKQQ